MNDRELKALLDRLDEKTTSVCSLTEAMRTYDQRWDRFHSLILGFGTPRSESTEEFIKRVIAEHKKMAITEREYSALISSLDEVPLEQDDGESYAAYALRVGDAMRALKDDKSTLQKDLHEARLEHSNDQSIISGLQQHVSNRDARIAQLEKRESELNELHDTIESLRGFPMEPEEKYSEYLHRMAAEVDQLRTQLDAANRRLLNAQGENQLLTSQRQIVEGELSLHQQVIARLMMQPGTDKIFDLDWNASARKVLIDARALCGDTAEANVVSKEQA